MARQEAWSFCGAPVDGIEFRVRIRAFVIYRKCGVIYLETLRKEVLLIERTPRSTAIHVQKWHHHSRQTHRKGLM